MKRKKRTRAKPKGDQKGHKGYDFGSEALALILPNIDFLKLLSQSRIVACAYGYHNHSGLAATIPVISVLGEVEAPLIAAFRDFERWCTSQDGDAVELTFVFLDSGGYLVGINPETSRAYARLSHFDRTCRPLIMCPTFVNKFDSRHRALEQIRQYKARINSPFLFAAGLIRGAPISPAAAVVPIKDCPEILKCEATFVEESAVVDGTTASLILRTHRGQVQKGPGAVKQAKRLKRPQDFFLGRASTLKRHFPVTLERLRNDQEYLLLRSDLAQLGIVDWQFEQAFCNHLLSAAICSGQKHYVCVQQRALRDALLQGLAERFEGIITDGIEVARENIVEQVRLDGVSLLKEIGALPPSTVLESILKKLDSTGYLRPDA